VRVEWWEAVVLGLVEGITEFLPVSSTGHLILASWLLGLDAPETKPALDAFQVVVQGGAVLAVLLLYRERVTDMLRGVLGRSEAGRRLVGRLVLAFLPAALLGPVFHAAFHDRLFRPGPVLAALLLGGVWMIWLGRRGANGESAPTRVEAPARSLDDIPARMALMIGLFQCVSLWPGTSRSMMTIAGGVLLGLRPKDAAEFSFLLGLPTLGAASLYSLLDNLSDAQATGGPTLFAALGPGAVVLGLVVAAVSAALAVHWLVGFLTRHGLGAFGWYRIALALVLGGLLFAGGLEIR
jgi:undecaprenyl-diphosphatase